MKTGPAVNASSPEPVAINSTENTPSIPTPTINSSSPATPVVNTNASAQPVPPEQLQQEQHLGNDIPEKETFQQKMSRWSNNCWQSTGLCCFTAKEQSQIAALEFQIVQRQKKFGVDYLTMVLANQQAALNGNSPPEAPIAESLDRCVQEAVTDIIALQNQIDNRQINIDQRTVDVQSRLQPAPGTPSGTQPTTAAAVLIDEGVPATPEHPSSTPTSPAAAFASAPAGETTSTTNTAPAAASAENVTHDVTKESETPAAAK